MSRQKLLFLCKDACNCDLGRANIDRLFYKWNNISISELSGYSSRERKAATMGTGVGREGGGSACSQASGLLASSSTLFFLSRISATKKQENNDSTHQGEPQVIPLRNKWLQAALPGEWGHDRSYLRCRWGLPSRASGAPILTRPIYSRGKWPIYLWDLCQVLTCGRLSNAKMDRKEVKSCNFTFKICISRQKYVQEGMRLSAVWWTTLRTI